MTVSTELCTATRLWTGVEPNYPLGFPLDATSTVTVAAVSATGAETILTPGVHFNLVRNPVTREGIVVPLAMPAPPQTLYIKRSTPAVQAVDLVNNRTFDAGVVEGELDRNAMRDAEIARSTMDLSSRALRVPAGETIGPIPAAAARASKMLGFDIFGQPVPMTSGDAGAVEVNNIVGASVFGKQLLQVATAAAARALIETLGASAMPKRTVVRVFSDSFGIFEGGFTAPLAAQLGAEFTVINNSIGGDTLQMLLDRINQDIRRMGDTDIVVGMPGINDVILAAETATPAATVIADATARLQQIWNALKASGIYVIWGTLPPLKGFVSSTPIYTWSANTQAAIDGINAFIMASTTIDRAVDTYAVLNDPADPGALKYDYTKVMAGHAVDDKLHPNPDGYAAIAAAFVTSGTWPRRPAEPWLEVLKPGLRFNQSLTEADHAIFRALSIGQHVNPGVATHTIRSHLDTNKVALDDVPQLGLEQINSPGTMFTWHWKHDGVLYGTLWVTGVKQRDKIAISGEANEISGLYGRWDIIDDTRPLRIRGSTFGGGAGSAVDVVPFTMAGTVVGWEWKYFKDGGGAFGYAVHTALEHIFTTGGPEKVRIKSDGRLNLAYLPVYASNAAALAGGLDIGDVYGISSGGNILLARVS